MHEKQHSTWHEQICNGFTAYGAIHYLILSKDSRCDERNRKHFWNTQNEKIHRYPVWHTSTAGLYYSTQKHTLKCPLFCSCCKICVCMYVSHWHRSRDCVELNSYGYEMKFIFGRRQKHHCVQKIMLFHFLTQAKHFSRPHNFHVSCTKNEITWTRRAYMH